MWIGGFPYFYSPKNIHMISVILLKNIWVSGDGLETLAHMTKHS